jgi:localization factor PodJL
MAGHDNNARHGAKDAAAAVPADDLKALLDSLAHEITSASTRHTETIHDMQGRAAAIGDRASAAKVGLPHEYGAAIDRIEAAMSSFSERLTDVEPTRYRTAPTHEMEGALPETVRSEVRRAILSAHNGGGEAPHSPRSAHMDFSAPESPAPMPSAARRSAFGESGEEVLSAPAAPAPQAAAPASASIEPSWLEARFANIAERVEQSLAAHSPHNALLTIGARFDQLEQRFDRALGEITSRPGADPEALKTVERQITELFTQLDRTTGQLGRLDAIESRLTDLRQSLSESLSDEQMTRLMGALAPTDEKLAAIATSAAERVAASIRSEMPAAAQAASGMVSDPRLVELTAMLDAFIGEQRQGDVLTTEALDTMQQAMQHLIDRVEAIEAAQITNHEALMQAGTPHHAEAREPQIFSMRTPEPARMALPEENELALPAAKELPDAVPPAAEPELPAPPANDALAEPPGAPAPKPPAGGDLDRKALIAMARRAAEKVSSEPPPAPRAAPGRSLPRSGIVLVAGVAAFVLVGVWFVAGPSLRGLIPSFNLGAIRGGDRAPAMISPAQANLSFEKQQGSLSDQPTAAGIVERAATTDAEENGLGEQARPASLSTRVDQDPVRAAPTMPSTADLLAAASRGPSTSGAAVPAPPPAPTMSRAVEMPPAMIGPLSLRDAAAKGAPQAQFEVAARFAEGKGVPQDFALAATWYQRAAAQGLATAQYRLATLYERGLGVTADPARARVWYSRAAEQGNLRAMHNLAVLSAHQPGTRLDYPSAAQWFTEAASRGLADSQYNLGILYESGLGVPANNLEAYKWYALAARSGDKDATRRRDSVRAKLDSASVRAADALVVQWRAKAVEAAANDGRVAGQSWQPVRQ